MWFKVYNWAFIFTHNSIMIQNFSNIEKKWYQNKLRNGFEKKNWCFEKATKYRLLKLKKIGLQAFKKIRTLWKKIKTAVFGHLYNAQKGEQNERMQRIHDILALATLNSLHMNHEG